MNPRVFEKTTNRPVRAEEEDDTFHDEIDSREIFGKFGHGIDIIYVLWTREGAKWLHG